MNLVVGEHVVRADEAALARFRENALLVESATVVTYFDGDVAAAMAGIEVYGAGGGLARGAAGLRHIETEIDAVSDDVHE
ncbi:MAG: hypothetical protein ACRETD_09045, partial [Steroidobacteraceae bacterium]